MEKRKNEAVRWGLRLAVSIVLVCILALFVMLLLFKNLAACGCYNPIYDMTATALAAHP